MQCLHSECGWGDQLSCLSPGGALLPQLRNLMELTWLLKLRHEKCNSYLIGSFLYIHIVLQDLIIIITSLVSIK